MGRALQGARLEGRPPGSRLGLRGARGDVSASKSVPRWVASTPQAFITRFSLKDACTGQATPGTQAASLISERHVSPGKEGLQRVLQAHRTSWLPEALRSETRGLLRRFLGGRFASPWGPGPSASLGSLSSRDWGSSDNVPFPWRCACGRAAGRRVTTDMRLCARRLHRALSGRWKLLPETAKPRGRELPKTARAPTASPASGPLAPSPGTPSAHSAPGPVPRQHQVRGQPSRPGVLVQTHQRASAVPPWAAALLCATQAAAHRSCPAPAALRTRTRGGTRTARLVGRNRWGPPAAPRPAAQGSL